MVPSQSGGEMEQGIEIKFAQKLAGNEKEGRDKALRKLKKWIQLKTNPESSENAFSELELLKLWKGLFFCMWMSDKPLVQEQLAEDLSLLVHVFPHRVDGITFCSTFLTTMAREWHSIDCIRRDKFMMLVRRVLRQALVLLLPSGDSSGSLERLVSLCRTTFARKEDPATLPLGLQLHLIEILLEEVAKVAGDRITREHMHEMLAPFIEVLQVTKQSALRGTITDSIFYHLMRQSDVGIAHDAIVNGQDVGSDDEEGEEDDEEEQEENEAGDAPLDPRAGGVDVMLPQLDVDYGRLAEAFLSAGAEPGVRQKNRAALYRLAQQFRDLDEGDYPLALKIPDKIDSDSDISDEDMEAAVLRLQTTKNNLNKDSRKNQKRLQADAEEVQPKKKKKIKHKLMLSNGVIDTGDEMMAEAAREAPVNESASEPEQDPSPRRKTLKDRRRQKIKERREAELKKEKKKARKAKQKALLNGSVEENQPAMVNGVNGDHDMAEGEPVMAEGAAEPSDLPVSTTNAVQTSSSLETPKKKKKHTAQKQQSPEDGVATSIAEEPVSQKKKKKNKRALSVDSTSEAESAVTPAATPEVTGEQASGDSTASPQQSPVQKKKKSKKTTGAETPAAAVSPVSADGPSAKKKKSKKTSPSAAVETAEPAAANGAAADSASPSAPLRSAPIDWSLGTEDNWDDATPAPAPAATQKKTPKKSLPSPAKSSQVAHFVPSKPMPAFVKLRGTPGKPGGAKAAAQASPATPRTPGGTKKVIINLAENKAQGFKEHLITVRNSPQVPHNPHRRPVKGLLKTTPSPAPKASPGRRSHAADFFSV